MSRVSKADASCEGGDGQPHCVGGSKASLSFFAVELCVGLTASNQIGKTGSWSVVAAPRLNKSPSYLTWPLPGQLIQSLLLVLVEVRVCDSQGGVLHLQPGGLPGLLLHRSALLIAVDLASD